MAELFEYKCPNCSGAIEFDSSTQKMKCPYCDSEFVVESLRNRDNRLEEMEPDSFSWNEDTEEITWDENEGVCVFVCNSCGGEIVGDENTAATACPYCGNPVVMSGRLAGDLKPDFVIPFQLNKEQAVAALKQYVGKKKFAPNTFKSENRLSEVRGIYVPFWLFDSDAQASVSYDATRTRHWSDSKYNYTETSHYDVFRAGNMRFVNIPVDGSSKMPDDLMESIEPFRFDEAVDFQTAYLAGYLADKYDVTKENSIDRANERVRVSCIETLRDTVSGFDTVTVKDSNVQSHNGSCKYALYPVWILNTKYKNEILTFGLNGQTGKIVGNIPVSKAKLWALFAGLTVSITPLIFGVGRLFGIL